MVVIVMIAMLVIMVVVMIMRMIVAVVVVIVLVAMIVVVRLAELVDFSAVPHLAVLVPAAIGARLRLEGGFDCRNSRTKALQHFLEHAVGCDPEVAGADFDRHMSIAEVVRGARERLRTIAFDVNQLFHFRYHFNDASIGRRHEVAAPQHLPSRQHERNLFARDELRV